MIAYRHILAHDVGNVNRPLFGPSKGLFIGVCAGFPLGLENLEKWEGILVIIINLDFAGAAAAVRPTLDDTVTSLEASSNDTVSCQIYF